MSELALTISNVGGIDQMECRLTAGITAITGPNASNKTSLLQAIAFGFGRDTVPIKADADTARVELRSAGRRVERTARRTADGVAVDDDGWVTADEAVAVLERFATLLEFSDVREAVRTGGDVESLLKSPVDLDALERQRARKLEQKRERQRSIDAAADLEERLAATNDDLVTARDRVADLEAELEELRERQAAATSVDDDLEDLHEERASLVSERNEHADAVEQLTTAIQRLDDQIAETESAIDEARAAVTEHDVAAIRERRREIEAEKADIDDRLDVLQSVLTANREMLESPYTGVLGKDSGVMDDTISCWACGAETQTTAFRDTIDELANLVKQERDRRNAYEPQLEELDEQIETAESAQRRLESLEEELADLKARRRERTDSLATREERLGTVRDRLADLDVALEERSQAHDATTADLATAIEDTRIELHEARSTVDDLVARREELDAKLDERAAEQKRVATLTDEIGTLTDRIENLEADLRSGFNDAMDDLLDVLEYDRIERIWLDGAFDLVVARAVDGVVREDTVAHLSESERETVGLVLGLAGYLAYEAGDSVPVVLIDALGAFDPDRTAALLRYASQQVPYLVVAIQPESADALGAATDVTRLRPAADDAVLQ